MPQFAANLTMLFNEVPFLERFAASKAAGFDVVECQFPYAYEVGELVQLLLQYQQKMVLHNLPAGNWDAGDRGIACDPNRVNEFRAGVATAIEYATALQCKQVNCLAGKVPAGVSHARAHATFIENLKYAAAELHTAGVRLLIEPINHFDIPGFFLTTTQQAIAIMDEVGSNNLYLQYDIYHAQRMEGELGNTISKVLARIGHIQLADNPGRNEPGTGEINYAWLLKHIDALGYRGYVGCEYKPKTTTQAGLVWREHLQV